MNRQKLRLPDRFHFATELGVRVQDINYGGHLGNDKFLALIHEARIRFLRHFGFTELDVGGVGLVVVDAVVVYKAEVFHGEVLSIAVTVDGAEERGCDFYYKIVRNSDGKEVARAKTGIVFFDFKTRKMARMPEPFRTKVLQEEKS